jgi:hypothetical protein
MKPMPARPSVALRRRRTLARFVGSRSNSAGPSAGQVVSQRKEQANPSVNLRANGWPRYRAISFSLARGQPLAPGYLER